jgi:hypothetical protein
VNLDRMGMRVAAGMRCAANRDGGRPESEMKGEQERSHRGVALAGVQQPAGDVLERFDMQYCWDGTWKAPAQTRERDQAGRTLSGARWGYSSSNPASLAAAAWRSLRLCPAAPLPPFARPCWLAPAWARGAAPGALSSPSWPSSSSDSRLMGWSCGSARVSEGDVIVSGAVVAL